MKLKLREDKDLLEELHTNHIGQLKEYAELASELGNIPNMRSVIRGCSVMHAYA